jgi:hypothetical protein
MEQWNIKTVGTSSVIEYEAYRRFAHMMKKYVEIR